MSDLWHLPQRVFNGDIGVSLLLDIYCDWTARLPGILWLAAGARTGHHQV